MTESLDASAPAADRIEPIMAHLREAYPDARCALDFTTPLELLVATILSAQCTDERVNMVTPDLFAQYPDAQAYAEADLADLENTIRSTGFYRNKAKNIQATCRMLLKQYDGKVPAEMTELTTLPGVARKTANVVLGNAYHKAEGIAVDTHVKRLAGRLGLSEETKPEKIEQDLMALVPRSEWIDVSHLLIFHGRQVCQARKPDCAHCVVNRLCPSAEQ